MIAFGGERSLVFVDQEKVAVADLWLLSEQCVSVYFSTWRTSGADSRRWSCGSAPLETWGIKARHQQPSSSHSPGRNETAATASPTQPNPSVLGSVVQTTVPRLGASGRHCGETMGEGEGGKDVPTHSSCVHPSNIFHHLQNQLCGPLQSPSSPCVLVPFPWQLSVPFYSLLLREWQPPPSLC